jgi:hypothetical protein
MKIIRIGNRNKRNFIVQGMPFSQKPEVKPCASMNQHPLPRCLLLWWYVYKWGSCSSIFSFLCNILYFVMCPFVLFLLAIALSILRITASDYPVGIFKLFCQAFARPKTMSYAYQKHIIILKRVWYYMNSRIIDPAALMRKQITCIA